MKTWFTLYCHTFFTVHSKAQIVAIGILIICQPVALRKSLRPWKISWPLGMFHLILPSLSLQSTYSLFNLPQLNWICLDLKTCTGKYFWKFCKVVAQAVWQQSRSSLVLCLWHCALLIREMTNRQRVRAAAYLPQMFSPLVVPVLETWSTSTQNIGTLYRLWDYLNAVIQISDRERKTWRHFGKTSYLVFPAKSDHWKLIQMHCWWYQNKATSCSTMNFRSWMQSCSVELQSWFLKFWLNRRRCGSGQPSWLHSFSPSHSSGTSLHISDYSLGAEMMAMVTITTKQNIDIVINRCDY